MAFELSIYGLSSLLLGFVGLFAALALALSDREEAARPFWLSAFLAGLSLPMLLGFFAEAGWLDHPLAFYPPTIGAFAAGPSLYLYARLPWRIKLQRRDWLHALPMIVGVLAAVRWGWARSGSLDADGPFLLWAVLLYTNGIFYSLVTLRMLGRYRRALRNHFSDTYQRRLNWLRLAAWGMLAVIVTDIVFGLLLETKQANLETARLTVSLLLSLMIFFLSLSALRHPARFLVELAEAPTETKQAYATSGLTGDTLERWAGKLERIMDEEQPYLVNDLTLAQLAEQMGVRPHNLSQLLNQSLGMTFYDYINSARVRHACALLKNSRDTVLDVAFASGFNNKATFYSAFRQQMSTTPSAYRQGATSPGQPSAAA